MNLTLRQLEIIVAIGDTLSLTMAAERLGISQPSVSETLRRVEAELGCRLFQRTTRQLKPTPEGRHVVASAREATRSLAGTFEAIARRNSGPHGRIAVAALPSVVCALLPKVLSRFRARFPGIAVTLRDSLQDRAMTMLENGDVDFVVAGRPADQSPFLFEEIASDRLSLVVARGHAFSGRDSVSWRELAGQDFVAITPASSVRHLTDAGFVQANLPVAPAYEVDQIPCAAALVAAGLGIAVLPESTFAMFSHEGLSTVPLSGPVIRRSIGISSLRQRQLSPGASAFVTMLRESATIASDAAAYRG